METVYDWLTVGLFAALIVLFLQRSSAGGEPVDSLWQYLAASIGCAVANYFGNEGQHMLAAVVLVATVAYIVIVLKPFGTLHGPKP